MGATSFGKEQQSQKDAAQEDPADDEEAFLSEIADIVMDANEEASVRDEGPSEDFEIPGSISVEPSHRRHLLEELQANVNNVPRFVPEGALTWKDTVTAEVHGIIIVKKTTRTWRMPGGETVFWEKVDEKAIELEPDEEPLDDLDLEDIEREFQAKLDLAAQTTLEKTLVRMVKGKE
jgi:hypothetical protein